MLPAHTMDSHHAAIAADVQGQRHLSADRHEVHTVALLRGVLFHVSGLVSEWQEGCHGTAAAAGGLSYLPASRHCRGLWSTFAHCLGDVEWLYVDVRRS